MNSAAERTINIFTGEVDPPPPTRRYSKRYIRRRLCDAAFAWFTADSVQKREEAMDDIYLWATELRLCG